MFGGGSIDGGGTNFFNESRIGGPKKVNFRSILDHQFQIQSLKRKTPMGKIAKFSKRYEKNKAPPEAFKK